MAVKMEASPAASMALFVSFTIALGILWMCDATVQVVRPRGVSLSNEHLYNKDSQGEWFTCLDGSLKIPRSQLNDDYCDCPDFSDEPGTSACPDGKFHCNNRGFRPQYIPSSRVNDGICDCCDASDEYEGPGVGVCMNNCKELGRKDLEEKRQQIVLFNQGFDIRQEYIKDGQVKKTEREDSLKQLESEQEDTKVIMEVKQKLKDAAETPEREAKEKHKAVWEAEVAAKKVAEDREKAILAFKELDLNSDGRILLDEFRSHTEFDADSSGEVNDEEAKNALGGFNVVDETTFVENVWNSIKEKFKFASQLAAEQAEAEAGEQQEGVVEPPGEEPAAFDDIAGEDEDFGEDFDDELEEDEWADDDDEDVEENDFDEDTAEEMRKLRRERQLDRLAKRREMRDKDNGSEEEMPEYDEETKTLIAAADQARNEFDEADGKLKNIDRSIGDIEKQLKIDLGPEQEFQVLQGQCYEFTDREYVYKLCPFEKSSQKSKNGGSETSLGSWDQWKGPSDNKYSVMMYTRGQKCWNGPDRSTKVILNCGIENKITSASEPDRCVYQFEFTSPALCTYKYDLSTGEMDQHDEL